MRILIESQPVSKPTYVHLAYVSTETTAPFLLGAAIILGIVILVQGAYSVWQNWKAKPSKSKTADLPQTAKNDKV
jgi:hypothetical protein